MDRLFTVKECANILHISPYTLYRMTYNGKIRYIRIGNKKRFSIENINEYIEKNTQ